MSAVELEAETVAAGDRIVSRDGVHWLVEWVAADGSVTASRVGGARGQRVSDPGASDLYDPAAHGRWQGPWSLNAVLEHYGLRTERARWGDKRVVRVRDGEELFTGSAHGVWGWLRKQRAVRTDGGPAREEL